MKIDRKEFENLRVEIYAIFQTVGILQCVLPFKYLCDYDNYSCVMCGMRRAIDYILQLDFRNAYNSNPLILVLVSVSLFMLIDTALIVFRRVKKH